MYIPIKFPTDPSVYSWEETGIGLMVGVICWIILLTADSGLGESDGRLSNTTGFILAIIGFSCTLVGLVHLCIMVSLSLGGTVNGGFSIFALSMVFYLYACFKWS